MIGNSAHLKQRLSLIDGIFLVAGSMIGSGIFIVSADIFRNVGSAGWLIAVWLIGALMTLTAALSYVELSGMFPKAGGQYTYLRETFNPLVAFLYGWSLFAVIQTGTIAAVGVSFFKFLAYVYPSFSEDVILFQLGSWKVSPAQIAAVALIQVLTYVNTLGLNRARWVQFIFTSTKLLSIGLMIVFGFYFFNHDVWNLNWQMPWDVHHISKEGKVLYYSSPYEISGSIAAALVGAIISYDAWNNVTFVASEMKNSKRNVGLSLLLGTVLVSAIYILLNLMFTVQLSGVEIATAEKDRVGLLAASHIFGDKGTILFAFLIMVATFGCNNGLILSGSRVYYSMANDGLFFKEAGILNKKAVPGNALWLQGIAASILCLSGRYGDLLDMISFVVVIFYFLTITGIFVLRVRKPNIDRPFKIPLFPFIPIIYLILSAAFCVLLIFYKPVYTVMGLVIALMGLPLYFIFMKKQRM